MFAITERKHDWHHRLQQGRLSHRLFDGGGKKGQSEAMTFTERI
jgi:hypothetical protein